MQYMRAPKAQVYATHPSLHDRAGTLVSNDNNYHVATYVDVTLCLAIYSASPLDKMYICTFCDGSVITRSLTP